MGYCCEATAIIGKILKIKDIKEFLNQGLTEEQLEYNRYDHYEETSFSGVLSKLVDEVNKEHGTEIRVYDVSVVDREDNEDFTICLSFERYSVSIDMWGHSRYGSYYVSNPLDGLPNENEIEGIDDLIRRVGRDPRDHPIQIVSRIYGS